MADCYIVRRGGTGGGKVREYFIPPIEPLINGKFLKWTVVPDEICLPDVIYEQGEVWSSTPADKISVVDLSTPVTIDGYTANSAVKIYGAGNDNITYGWNFTINVPENNEKVYSLLIGVSSEGSTYDLAYVEVNGTQIGSYTTTSGTLTKRSIPLELSVGENTVTVKYKKESSSSKGDDCVYIYGYIIGHYEFVEVEE